MLTLYPMNLLYLLICSKDVFCFVLGLYFFFGFFGQVFQVVYKAIVSSVYFFPTYVPFISCSCLIALVRIFSIMLNRSGKRGHYCFVPHLRGKMSSLSPLCTMLVVSFL